MFLKLLCLRPKSYTPQVQQLDNFVNRKIRNSLQDLSSTREHNNYPKWKYLSFRNQESITPTNKNVCMYAQWYLLSHPSTSHAS